MPNPIKAAKAVGRFVWNYLIPHFETEDVALRYVGDDITVDRHEWSSYEVVCPMSCVWIGEEFDGIAEAESFTWLGIGITYRIGNFRPWPKGLGRG